MGSPWDRDYGNITSAPGQLPAPHDQTEAFIFKLTVRRCIYFSLSKGFFAELLHHFCYNNCFGLFYSKMYTMMRRLDLDETTAEMSLYFVEAFKLFLRIRILFHSSLQRNLNFNYLSTWGYIKQ